LPKGCLEGSVPYASSGGIVIVLVIFVIVLNIQFFNDKPLDNVIEDKITSNVIKEIVNVEKIIDNSSEVKIVIEESNKRSKNKKSSRDSDEDDKTISNESLDNNPIINNTNQTVFVNDTIEEYDNLTVTFIDVGQADSALINYKDYNILVDCGYGSESYDFLVKNNITKIDLIVASHPDADHVKGCIKIMENLDVDFVWDNGVFRDDVQFYKDYFSLINEVGYKNVSNEDFIEFDDLKLDVVHSNMNHSNLNDNSIVLRLDYFNFSVLFMGDCRFDCEEEIDDVDVDILKVGHHGSKYSSSLEFLSRVNASVAVISVGENSYGHPTAEVLDRLSVVYRTDLDGNIKFVNGVYIEY